MRRPLTQSWSLRESNEHRPRARGPFSRLWATFALTLVLLVAKNVAAQVPGAIPETTDGGASATTDAGVPASPVDAAAAPSPAAPAGAEGAAPAVAAPGSAASPGDAGEQAAPAPALRVAVVDAAPDGVDPAAATFVTDVLRQAVADMGLSVVPTPDLYAAARRIALRFPVPVEGLVDLTRELGVRTALTADVRAGGGYYRVTLRARFVDEPVERVREIVASQWTLGDALRRAVPGLLAPTPPPQQLLTGWPEGIYPVLPEMATVSPPPRRRPYRMHPQTWEIAGGVEFAIGPGIDSFFNFLLYARGALFLHDRIGLTASLAYGNLRGRTARVSNVLPMVGIETAVDIIPQRHIYMPLRAEVGYLPFNGPVLRATAGLAFSLTRNIRLEFDILSPTVWILPEVTPVSLDLGVQIIYGIGGPSRARRHRRPRTPSTTSTGAQGNGASTNPHTERPTGTSTPATGNESKDQSS